MYLRSNMKFLNIKTKINLLIEKAKQNAAKSIAEKIVGFISLIESIIFPIPVDPFLAGLTLAAPQKSIQICIILYNWICCWRDNYWMVAWLFYRTFN